MIVYSNEQEDLEYYKYCVQHAPNDTIRNKYLKKLTDFIEPHNEEPF